MPKKPQKDLFSDAAVPETEALAADRRQAELWEYAELPLGASVARVLRETPTRECLRHARMALRAGAPELAYEIYRVAIEHAWGFEKTAGEHDPVERAWGHAGCAACCEKLGWSGLKEDHLLLGLQDLAIGTQGRHPRYRHVLPARDIEQDRYAARVCFVAVKLTGDGAVYERYEEICEALQDFWTKRYRGSNAEQELYDRIGEVSQWAEWTNRSDEPGQKTIFPESEAHRTPQRQREPSELIRSESADRADGPVPQLELFERAELPALNHVSTALEQAEGAEPAGPDGG
ncbi:MAG TPA: hypothetical protein VIF43_02265 [Patescibacteria group bacterium]|jgi:hypothetical protein